MFEELLKRTLWEIMNIGVKQMSLEKEDN